MATHSIPPLRYQKGSNGSSPNKAANRPLSELSPMAIRRNSPSFPQGKTSTFKTESSPAPSSPFSVTNGGSPHLFWQKRDPASPSRENQAPADSTITTSPSKRSSIENLKKASRVKNSNIFAKEQQHLYDPAKPTILDGRPLSMQLQGNAYNGHASDGFGSGNMFSSPLVSIYADVTQESHTPQETENPAPLSPSKSNASPTKSSLSKRTGANFRYSSFDPETGIWEDGTDKERKLEEVNAYAFSKSVTFDQAPPQINEYEMTTPVPSSVASGSREGSYDTMDDDEEDISFERGSSMDHDDSFDASLEDTDKTPVVLPEDWRFMSPDTANLDLAQHEEDVFDETVGSPEPTALPGQMFERPHQTSVNSVDSDGQARPLPPLPPMDALQPSSGRSRDSLSGTIERMSNGQRALPSPPQAASLSKSDLRRMSLTSLSIEDRLGLMMINKDQEPQSEAEIQRERRLRRADSKESSPARSETFADAHEHSVAPTGLGTADDLAPRLDRLSILNQLRSADLHSDSDSEESEPLPRSLIYDPDVPIPSLEDPTQPQREIESNDADTEIAIKEEDIEDDNGLYSIPDMYCRSNDSHSEVDDEESSQYSQSSRPASLGQPFEPEIETPRAQSPAREPEKSVVAPNRVSLPDFMDFGEESSFNLGLSSYMTPPIESANMDKALPQPPVNPVILPDLEALRNSIQRPFTPEEQLEPPKLSFSGDESSADPGTPNSVIRHPIARSPEPEFIDEADAHDDLATIPALEQFEAEPAIDDVQADLPLETTTTRSPQLQVKPAEKRISSLVQLQIPSQGMDLGLGLDLEQDFDRVVETQKVAFELSLQHPYHPFNGRFPSGELPKSLPPKNPMEKIPHLPRPDGARATGEPKPLPIAYTVPLNIECIANRSPGRQRGYLMRQNTKVVVASEWALPEETRRPVPVEGQATDAVVPEANEVYNSTRKASQPTWTAEPWNSKSRRRSIRVGGEKATAKRKPVDGPAPPLPGLPSNVQENLGVVAEDELAEEEAEEVEDGAERGRLFVKVVGVKDLQLPFPKTNERTQFALTLDNGLHCVTTAWLDLAREAPIGQEFELVVLNDLEFQLTLQMKLEEPKVVRPASPTKPPPSPKKQGAFSRFFGSPKKKETDHRFSQSQEVRQPITPPSAYELVQGIVAKDGSFARAYVSLSDHEKKTYGRPYIVDIKCFNEWALEEVHVGSSRSKKSVPQMQRRPPYEIGKLELQLMYVPKPKGAKDEDMPKSMNGAIRALREAEEKVKQRATVKEFEGHLSQQGGDCPYWRRRYFKLVGSKFTAYHESTLQPRATINLNKASKLIDDKSALMQKETTTKSGGRRKSAFAEEEEGYMFVEEGFRIKFANGEVIDFYADSAAHKDEWMQALSQVVGKNISHSSATSVKGWAEMVLKREKSTSAKSRTDASTQKIAKEDRQHERPSSAVQSSQSSNTGARSIPVPSSASALPRPSGHARTESYQAPASKSQASSPVKSQISSSERRLKARSMLL